ncbi:MAG TPA: hypothetical protein VGR49_02775 [Actinomycetota bacterium]|jgi:hypothetical protein|nr:hypothetical protein [Actinomycetota bacterium]
MAVTRFRMRPAWTVVLLLPLVVLMAACRDVGPTGGEAGGEMSLSILKPEDGAMVSGKVDLAISVEGTEIGPPESGAMHFHVYVDDSDQYEVVPSTETTVSVPNGEHTLRVVLAHPNHEETQISDEVTFTVSAATGDTGDTGGGYGDYGGG